MTIMDIHKILHYLPHRYPFLLIDRVEHLEPGKTIIGLKNVTINEPYFTGHFPENPIMPGVVILEAMAQTAGILTFVTEKNENPGEVLYVFAGVDDARFKHVVVPGDQLRITMNLDRARQNLFRFTGEVHVGEKLACSATIMLAGRKLS